MNAVSWTGPAEHDLEKIDDYWFLVAPDLADAMLAKIEASVCFLRGMPRAGWRIEETEARRWSVRGTPYLLVYRIQADTIEILRVRHERENWQGDP